MTEQEAANKPANGFVLLLFVLLPFVFLKLIHVLDDWSWWAVTAPAWAPPTVGAIIALAKSL